MQLELPKRLNSILPILKLNLTFYFRIFKIVWQLLIIDSQKRQCYIIVNKSYRYDYFK